MHGEEWNQEYKRISEKYGDLLGVEKVEFTPSKIGNTSTFGQRVKGEIGILLRRLLPCDKIARFFALLGNLLPRKKFARFLDMFSRLLPRNKIVRFLVIEFMALLISFFLFASFYVAFFDYFLLKGMDPVLKGDIGPITIIATFYVSMLLTLICSLPLAVLIHINIFKKFK